MAAPVIESHTTGSIDNGGGTSNPMVLNVPSGTVDGDLLVICTRCGVNSTNRTFVKPSAFTSKVDFDTLELETSGVDHYFTLWFREASSEPASYSIAVNGSFANGDGCMLRISGADNTQIEGTPVTDTSGSGGTATHPSFTPAQDESLLLRYSFTNRTNAGFTTMSGHTELFDLVGYFAHGLQYKTQDASASGTVNYTYQPGWQGAPACGQAVFAISPATGGGGGTTGSHEVTFGSSQSVFDMGRGISPVISRRGYKILTKQFEAQLTRAA